MYKKQLESFPENQKLPNEPILLDPLENQKLPNEPILPDPPENQKLPNEPISLV
jgi:hypothetical protein